ncbi:hypothetical protein LXL04_025071 [Taraxacum kok-saghyz]
MALIGKKVAQFEIKSKCDVFHELWKTDPHQIPNVSPTTYQNCQTLEGEVGTVGSVLLWHYFHDGKDSVVKTLIEEIDEGKKSVTFKALDGDLLKIYKIFVVHIHVDTYGSNNLVTWTIEYEKLSPDVPDPDKLFDFFEKVTKDIETHHLNN